MKVEKVEKDLGELQEKQDKKNKSKFPKLTENKKFQKLPIFSGKVEMYDDWKFKLNTLMNTTTNSDHDVCRNRAEIYRKKFTCTALNIICNSGTTQKHSATHSVPQNGKKESKSKPRETRENRHCKGPQNNAAGRSRTYTLIFLCPFPTLPSLSQPDKSRPHHTGAWPALIIHTIIA